MREADERARRIEGKEERHERRKEKTARCREAESQGVARGKAPTTGRTIYEVSPLGEHTDFKCFQRLTFTVLPAITVPISRTLFQQRIGISRYDRRASCVKSVNQMLRI